MLSVSIKKEKEDNSPSENLNTADVSTRMIKTTAKTSIVKGILKIPMKYRL